MKGAFWTGEDLIEVKAAGSQAHVAYHVLKGGQWAFEPGKQGKVGVRNHYIKYL